MDLSLKTALRETRERFGTEIPRSFGAIDASQFFPIAPDWAVRDELYEVVRQREVLFNRGRIVLSARIMANRSLYSLGSNPSAMVVIWSEDAFFEEAPEELAFLAREVASIKNTSPGGDQAEVASLLTDEMSRPLNFPLPHSFSLGRPVFLSSLLVWREHLPFGFLTSMFLPLLVLPEETGATMILPGHFWSDALKDR